MYFLFSDLTLVLPVMWAKQLNWSLRGGTTLGGGTLINAMVRGRGRLRNSSNKYRMQNKTPVSKTLLFCSPPEINTASLKISLALVKCIQILSGLQPQGAELKERQPCFAHTVKPPWRMDNIYILWWKGQGGWSGVISDIFRKLRNRPV